MFCLKYPPSCFLSPSDNSAPTSTPPSQPATNGGLAPARWRRTADRQQGALSLGSTGGQGGPGAGGLAPCPSQRQKTPMEETPVCQGVCIILARGGQGAGAGHSQDLCSAGGSCCYKRLLERGRADQTSQENCPNPGLPLPPPPSREERGAARLLPGAAALRQPKPICFPSERETSLVFLHLGISKAGSKSVTILQVSSSLVPPATACFLQPQVLVQVTAGELEAWKYSFFKDVSC